MIKTIKTPVGPTAGVSSVTPGPDSIATYMIQDGAVTFPKFDYSGSTKIDARRASMSVPSTPPVYYVADNVVLDTLGELASGQNFVATDTGYYDITFYCEITNVSAGAIFSLNIFTSPSIGSFVYIIPVQATMTVNFSNILPLDNTITTSIVFATNSTTTAQMTDGMLTIFRVA